MQLDFKPQTTAWHSITWLCNQPFCAIRSDGTIYLSGDYTAEELEAILAWKRAKEAETTAGTE